jgi:hypothetical protein
MELGEPERPDAAGYSRRGIGIVVDIDMAVVARASP